MTALEYIKSKCVEANPEIKNPSPHYCSQCSAQLIAPKPLSPIQLADVLLAIQKSTAGWIISERDLNIELSWVDGTLNFDYWEKGVGDKTISWNLLETLDNQKPEVHAFIAHVLGWKGE